MSPSPSGLTFVDASGWIALVNRNDALHSQAVRVFQQRLDEGRGFVTSSVVLLEVGNLRMALEGDTVKAFYWPTLPHRGVPPAGKQSTAGRSPSED